MKERIFIVSCLLVLRVSALGNLSGATFTVTNTNDSGPGSFRDAITQANTTAGKDTIIFNISGTGPHTIFPSSQLPQLTGPSGVFINGLTQPGAASGINPPSTVVLMIEIDGTNAGAAHGLWILSSYNKIQGLVINNFQQDGIRIQGMEGGTHDNTIFCNFVGTDPTGTIPRGNGKNTNYLWAGINIIVIPDPYQIARYAYSNYVIANLSSDNHAEGVSISSCPPGDVYSNQVESNYIGTDITGTVDLGNRHTGVCIAEGPHDNQIAENLISGNDCEGVSLTGYAEAGIVTYNNVIVANTIGLDVNLNPLPNTRDGVNIGEYYGTMYQGGYVTGTQVGPNNIIAENGLSGISVWEHTNNTYNADGNKITQNAIYENGTLGIDLRNDGVTPNDATDPDMGPNQGLNFPVITSAIYSAGNTTITGTIDIDTNPTQAVVEVFKANRDPTGYGEGALYLDYTTPDATGNWSVVVTGLSPSDSVTATTTDMNSNTSEFSGCVLVSSGVGVGQALIHKPLKYRMYQNFPNPFNPSTAIRFDLPQNSHVMLKIYNLIGKEIETIVSEQLQAGEHVATWNVKDLPSGIYLYRLEAGDYVETRKLIVQK